MNPVDQLCPNCGLCCDSTLFADVELRTAAASRQSAAISGDRTLPANVELRPGDDPQRLVQLGLNIQQKTKTKLAFAQPCACFDGKLCKIYAERPTRCRRFACGLLKRLEGGQMTAGAALKIISQAREQRDKVRALLRESGQREEQTALTHRYAEAMSAPVDLSDERSADRHGELMLAVNDLMQLLEREFLR